MSGLLASLVLIGVATGVVAVLAIGVGFAIFWLDRLAEDHVGEVELLTKGLAGADEHRPDPDHAHGKHRKAG